MKTYYCWKCDCDAPFLDDDEWKVFSPHANSTVQAIKNYREENGIGLAEAKAAVEDTTVQEFFKFTGFQLPDCHAVYHHRLSIWGPECSECGQLIRTDRATFCANCGRPTGVERNP